MRVVSRVPEAEVFLKKEDGLGLSFSAMYNNLLPLLDNWNDPK